MNFETSNEVVPIQEELFSANQNVSLDSEHINNPCSSRHPSINKLFKQISKKEVRKGFRMKSTPMWLKISCLVMGLQRL